MTDKQIEQYEEQYELRAHEPLETPPARPTSLHDYMELTGLPEAEALPQWNRLLTEYQQYMRGNYDS